MLQINMGLFDSYNNGHNGTYMDSYGISCGNSRVNVTLIGKGDLRGSYNLFQTYFPFQEICTPNTLTESCMFGAVEMRQDENQVSSVLVSGEPLEAIIGDEACRLSIKMEAFQTPGGHTVEVKSGEAKHSIRKQGFPFCSFFRLPKVVTCSVSACS